MARYLQWPRDLWIFGRGLLSGILAVSPGPPSNSLHHALGVHSCTACHLYYPGVVCSGIGISPQAPPRCEFRRYRWKVAPGWAGDSDHLERKGTACSSGRPKPADQEERVLSTEKKIQELRNCVAKFKLRNGNSGTRSAARKHPEPRREGLPGQSPKRDIWASLRRRGTGILAT